jgi:serine/threonine protein kinase
MKADVWSIGVLLSILETGKLPWTAANNVQLYHQIANGLYDVPLEMDQDVLDAIAMSLQLDPKKRRSAAELLDLPFVRDGDRSGPVRGRRMSSATVSTPLCMMGGSSLWKSDVWARTRKDLWRGNTGRKNGIPIEPAAEIELPSGRFVVDRTVKRKVPTFMCQTEPWICEYYDR